MTERKLTVTKLVETANPAAVGWNEKGSESPQVTWSRGTRRLLIGFKGPDGRWVTTTIDNERFTPAVPTLKAAREAAQAFFDAAEEE